MRVLDAENLNSIDIYFDGCDFLDKDLNALKSGGGIHTDEKILASMAKEFILLGDTQKYIQKFDENCSFTLEVVIDSIGFIIEKLRKNFDIESVTIRKDSNQEKILTKRFGALLDMKFHSLPELEDLNNIKLWTGIIDHSLFHNLATQAILCGAEGTIHLTQPKK
jgi:ribose 5-phosphate isomerase A